MAKKLYGLLVGINDYPAEVGKLTGCLNDVDHFHDYLKKNFDEANLAIEVLKDSEATRENIINQFRNHLGQANEGDVAVFQYCGHGARWKSAKEFKEFYPDGKDEGLVCIDSRDPGKYDLADKELAVLISEVAKKNPHLAIILDSCHSGSGTRGVDAFSGLKPRLTFEVPTERPLDSYLDGYYAKLIQLGKRLSIPESKHILLAACERTQLAQEADDRSGVFTSTLIDVLNEYGSDSTYTEVFQRCRTFVRKRAQDQDPQFESVGNFDPWSGFLGRKGGQGPRYRVFFDGKAWKINYGAMKGAPTDADKSVGVSLYDEKEPSRAVGTAKTIEVQPQESVLELPMDLKGDESREYIAAITSLPVSPLLVYCPADMSQRAALETVLKDDQSIGAVLTPLAEGARYGLTEEGSNLKLVQRETGAVIQQLQLNDGNATSVSKAMMADVKTVAQWERSLALQNNSSQIDASLIDFVCSEPVEGKGDIIHEGNDVTLVSVKTGDDWSTIEAKVLVRNRTGQDLHMLLVYFSPDYGIKVLRPSEPIKSVRPDEPAEALDTYVTFFDQGFVLGQGKSGEWLVQETLDRFMLIASTKQIDGFLLEQRGINRPENRDLASRVAKKARKEDWVTKTLRVRVVPRLDELSDKQWSSENGAIVVKGHPDIKANVSMSAAKSGSRAAGEGLAFLEAYERAGLVTPNFANTRSTIGGDAADANQNVLELTDIQNAESLKNHPLEIEINQQLNEHEYILPFVFDGQHVLLGGNVSKDEQGHTHITIDQLPDAPNSRRSLGKSLKLYFFKAYLKQENLNQLRWVEYKPEGSFEYQKSNVAEKVTAAQNILLLVHGITGDTEGMAAGVRACGLDKTFDLVLTYDYENLDTAIEQTARKLKEQLEAAGLRENDGKRLTLLVHSMGGLVSRWFIEREGGNKVVDHLVMCGTPNNGSPFGQIESARKILKVLMGLSMNFFPALIPFSGTALMLLNRSKNLTKTLEQMNPSSDFIKTLNSSDDPGIRYTILAGDVGEYKNSDKFFDEMLTKTGQSFIFDALFASQANDIAVGVESILGVGGQRSIAPVRKNVPCHHMNYFVSESGQKKLMEVQWVEQSQ